MERNRVSFKSISTWGTILVVTLLAIIWLAEFFFKEKYTEAIYTYIEFWIFVVTPIVIWTSIFWIDYLKKKSKARLKSARNSVIEDFKAFARILNVNFDDCDITHHEYEKEIILRKDTRYQERRIVRFSECKIKYSVKENPTPVLYESPTLFMELINLRYKLYQQKETAIYIDKKGENRFVDENGKSYFADEDDNPFYYFDLEFLGETVFKRPSAD